MADAALVGSPWRRLRRAALRPRWLVGRLVTRVQEHRTLTLAAALAYYFLFALFPFLLFLLALVTVLPGVEGIEQWLLAQAALVVPAEAWDLLATTIRGVLEQPRGGLLSIGAVLALWSSSSALVGLADALNVAWGVHDRRPWWKLRLQCIGLTVALSLFMVVAFAATVSSAPLSAWATGLLGPLSGVAVLVLNWSVGFAAVTLVIASIYDKLPDVPKPWRWFTPGSLLFTLGFAATSAGFSAWVSRFGSYDKTYGSLGALIVLLLWMYLFAIFVLLGGELDATLAEPEAVGIDHAAVPPARDRESAAVAVSPEGDRGTEPAAAPPERDVSG